MNNYENRDDHIPDSAHPNNMWRKGQQPVCGLLRPRFRQITIRLVIVLEIELMIVRKNLILKCS